MATLGCRVHNVSHNKAKDGVQHEYLLFEVALLEEEYMSILIAERDAGDTRENTSEASKSADGDKSRPRSPSLTCGSRYEADDKIYLVAKPSSAYNRMAEERKNGVSTSFLENSSHPCAS